MIWALAVAVNYGGAGILHWLPGRGQRVGLGQTDIAGEHLIERFRLFFPIVLGESVLTAGNAFTDEPFEVKRLLALAIGFIGTVASRHSSSHVVPCVSPQLRRRSTRTS
jgi:low temperature requirement protein LtrA